MDWRERLDWREGLGWRKGLEGGEKVKMTTLEGRSWITGQKVLDWKKGAGYCRAGLRIGGRT